jgi:predicted ATPase/class 3 adenylate cyclase/Tfp pilus assembly protein PilF
MPNLSLNSGQRLPTGTVTFLFTDIEGSTTLAQQFPAEMPALLARHHAILHQAIHDHNGHVFQITGDAFCAAFHTASDALRAALVAQHDLQHETWNPAPIKVRMGLHTGAAQAGAIEERAGGYVGYLTLTRVQRVMSVAYGEQVLLSNSTAELVRGDLPADVALRDMGEHRLKGLEHFEHIWQLVAPYVRQDFPPLQSLNVIPNNLPEQLTSFIGREKELARVQEKLAESRLVTLTGSGGVGKTRLSIQAAHDCLSDYRHGAWLIELAPLADPALVPQAIVTTFGLQEDVARSTLTVLTDYLREKTLLLVLDNCEHVIDACAQLAEQLLLHCPTLHILASSREALGIDGEVALRVPSLSLPLTGKTTPEALSESEAAQLFVERATAALPGFEVTEANASAIAQVCRRLDGIALALELAASRVKVLRVEQIAGRLDDAFRLLTGGRRTALPRQQTLRATIDWSYNLLADAERTVLRRLSVFAGGATLEAAEAVCSDDELEAFEVLDILTQLVNKSLVVAEREQGRETRYYLLETIRQYAREKLNDSGEGEAVRERHTHWYMELAERAEPKLYGHGQIEWLDRMEQEHDNMRAALEWSLNNNVDLGLRIASALIWFWDIHSHAIEGLQQIEKLLAAGSLDPSPLQARALARASFLAMLQLNEERMAALAEAGVNMSREVGNTEALAFSLLECAILPYWHGEPDRALSLAEESLALFEEANISWGKRRALSVVGYVTQAQGNYERARAAYQKALALCRESGDINHATFVLLMVGGLEFEQGDYESALAFFVESLSNARVVKNKGIIAANTRVMGDIAMVLGHYAQAKVLFEESLVLEREVGGYERVALLLNRLGRVARLQGEYVVAARLYVESLHLAQKIRHRQGQAWCLVGLAELATLRHQLQKAARLLGAAQAIPERYILLWPYERLELEQMANTIRDGMDEATFKIEQEVGQQLTLDEAIVYALKETDA